MEAPLQQVELGDVASTSHRTLQGWGAPQNQEKSKLEHDVEEQVDSSSVAQLTPPSELDSMQSGLFQFPE